MVGDDQLRPLSTERMVVDSLAPILNSQIFPGIRDHARSNGTRLSGV